MAKRLIQFFALFLLLPPWLLAQPVPGITAPLYASGGGTTSTINYTATGSTTPLTLQKTLDGQTVDIRSFGAVMNTTTDQTAAFAAAIVYLGTRGGGVIHIPPGYIYANVVINQHGVTLEGPGITEMQHTPSNNYLCAYNPLLPAVQISDGTTITSGAMVRDLCISDPNSVMHTGLLFADGAYESGADHVQINNFTVAGLKFECDNIHPTSFNHCIWIQIQTNATGAYGIQYLDNGDGTIGWVTECNVDHFFATVGSGYQVVNKGKGNTLANGYLQCSISGWGVLVTSGSVNFNSVTMDSMNNPPTGFLGVQATIDAGYDYRVRDNWSNAEFIQGHLNAAGNMMVIAGHTTGTTTASSPSVVVASTTGIVPGRQIHIPGAGYATSPLIATVLSISGTTLTLDTNATYSVNGGDVGYGDISRSFENIGLVGTFTQAPGFAFQASNIQDLGSSFQDKFYQASGSGSVAPFNNAGIIQQTGVGHSYSIVQQSGSSQAAVSSVVQGNVATSPVSAGTIVTVTTSTAHGAITGDICTVIGANQQGINTFGSAITVINATSYTYVSPSSVYTSAATGTITQTIYKVFKWLDSTFTVPNQINFQDNLTGVSHPVFQNSGVLGTVFTMEAPNQTNGYFNLVWGSSVTTGTGVVFGSAATNYLYITGAGVIQQAKSAAPSNSNTLGQWYTDSAGQCHAKSATNNTDGVVLTSGAAATTASSAAPSGTTSTTAVMMATGGTITPLLSTRIWVSISGQMANSAAGDGVTVDIRYGTGTAPVNGAAVSGTLVGIAQTSTSISASQKSGFCVAAPVTGLTVGTAYWFDVSVMAVTGGTASITGVTASAMEM